MCLALCPRLTAFSTHVVPDIALSPPIHLSAIGEGQR